MFNGKKFTLILWLLACSLGAFASADSLLLLEGRINAIYRSIALEESIARKVELSEQLASDLERCLVSEAAFNHPFDSLASLSKLLSADKRVRIFTWGVKHTAGHYSYFGVVTVNNNGKVTALKLNDKRSDFSNPHSETGTPSKWYGAVYYDIVDISNNEVTVYTLLGISMNNLYSSKRVIEILRLPTSDEVEFGLPIFSVGKTTASRVVFEYSARASMLLRWEKQHQMIVYNHLAPLRPDYTGNFQFYVPDLSYDGFRYNGQYWEYVADIDIKNPKTNKQKSPITPPTENFDPGFLYKSAGIR